MRKPTPTVVADRVVAARKARNLSQKDLANEVDMTQQAINAIEAGDVRRPTKLFDIANVLNVDVNYLLGVQDEPQAGTNEPLDHLFTPEKAAAAFETHAAEQAVNANLRRVASVPDLAIFAGMGGGGYLEVTVDEHGQPTDPDQVRGYWEFPEYMLRRFGNLRNVYAWEVRGDSMEPTLAGGAVVFVDTSQTVPPPDDIYAINYGDGLMVKRVKLIPRSDRMAIISDNDRYGTDELLREEVKIWGRVIGWFQWRA